MGKIDDYAVSRMSVVPHGITLVTEGTMSQVTTGDVKAELVKRQSNLPFMNIIASTEPIGSKVNPNPKIFPNDSCAPLLFNSANNEPWGGKFPVPDTVVLNDM